MTCSLVAEHGRMSGPCTTAAGPFSVQATGTYAGKTWDLSYWAQPFGRRFPVTFKGITQPDGAVNGTADSDGRAEPFAATR